MSSPVSGSRKLGTITKDLTSHTTSWLSESCHSTEFGPDLDNLTRTDLSILLRLQIQMLVRKLLWSPMCTGYGDATKLCDGMLPGFSKLRHDIQLQWVR